MKTGHRPCLPQKVVLLLGAEVPSPAGPVFSRRMGLGTHTGTGTMHWEAPPAPGFAEGRNSRLDHDHDHDYVHDYVHEREREREAAGAGYDSMHSAVFVPPAGSGAPRTATAKKLGQEFNERSWLPSGMGALWVCQSSR